MYDDDINEIAEPRTADNGRYTKECPHCHKQFRTNNPRTVYDTEECKKSAAFARYYQKQDKKQKIIKRVIANRKK